uniref:NADPH--cytochrome P450 reductase n=1 Tax=Starmerella bombicola TaxID=75736 RepID=A5Y0M3_STABO|nr:NADPH cytochrome P450 reductase [Starmerella bombicola]
MADINFIASVVVALAVVFVAYKYFNGGPDVQSSKAGNSTPFGNSKADEDGDSRDFVALMEKNNKNVIVFYGSQTGTAEDLASKLAKELSSKYGLRTMTADPENFDFEKLDTFPESHLAVFLMASYGDGEPTDNAQDLYSFLGNSPSFSQDGETLENLNFAVFGLGNVLYEFYNKAGKDMHKYLTDLGGHSIGPYGEGDDSKGMLEEDYMAWKDEFLAALVAKWGLTEREAVYEPSISVKEIEEDAHSHDVYLGEPNLKHLQASKAQEIPKGPYNASNPMLAKITAARELFTNTDRHCIHMEFDTTGARYTTGDHLAFWFQNNEEEVQRFVKALGIANPQQPIAISVLDKTSTVRIPSPTTYETIIRHFLEINGPVSRQVLSSIAPFAPSEEVKKATQQLGSNKELFASHVAAKKFNIARLLLHLSGGQPWKNVPFSFVIETIPHLQPRYYSISSSSVQSPNTVSITAVVERQTLTGVDHELRGVATNQILALSEALVGHPSMTYRLQQPHDFTNSLSSQDIRVPVHIRHSLFKLPGKPTVPIIMVGPGTGVAPFRGFVHERASQKAAGKEVGKAMLFTGSRHANEDFLYRDEWKQFSDFLDLETAFSRDSSKKVYVQHKLKERAKDVFALLNEGAVFYVCGDAGGMSHDVHSALLEIVAQEGNLSSEDADKFVRKMRSRNKYQEDVW